MSTEESKRPANLKLNIVFDEEGFRFHFGYYEIAVTDKKYDCFTIEVCKKTSNEKVFTRRIGQKAIDTTKMGSSAWKDFRTLIGLREEDKNWFISKLVDAANKIKTMTEIKEKKYQLTKEDYTEALAVLFRPGLDDYILTTLDKVIVGEVDLKQTVFHGGLSTYTFDPFSMKIEGASRGGKDATTGKTSDIFPPENVESFTSGMSRRAIEWMAAAQKDNNYTLKLDNKIWLFPDIDENTGHILKVLLSEGKKERQVALKEDGRIVSKKLVVEGKPACFFTTIIPNVGQQFENRLIKRSITETAEQTKLIVDYKKRCHAGLERSRLRNDKQFGDDPDATKICNAVRILRDRGLRNVVVPYGPLVNYPSRLLRDRGDVDHLFAFIKTHAFLHQFKRPRIDDMIIATLEDYYFAFDLMIPYLSASRAGIAGRSYDVWEYLKEKEKVTSKNVAMDIEDISQARASQILKSFYELDLATREKLPRHKGYLYQYKDVKDLKLGINKEIKPLFTADFFKEWFDAKFKNTQHTIEVYTSAEERKTIDPFELYLYITNDAKIKPTISQQNEKINPITSQTSLLIDDLTNLKGDTQASSNDGKSADTTPPEAIENEKEGASDQ